VFEDLCENCGRIRVVKYCKIRMINVCVDCCIFCIKRNNCDLRIWFKSLVPKDTTLKTQTKPKTSQQPFKTKK
jgi:predicted DNA-binding helix-hairpin-helix protein